MYYYSNHRQDLIELVPNGTKKSLDVGCGPGHTSRLCKQKGMEVYGVEIVPDTAGIAVKVLDRVIFTE